MTESEIIEWVEQVVLPKAGSQAEMARQMQTHLRKEFDRSKINKVLLGKRDLTAVELLVIEDIYGVSAPKGPNAPKSITVPLISWVSAGNLALPDAVLNLEDAPRVGGPDLDPQGDWVALKVVGDSMDKISPPDSIIFINRKDKRLVPNACYVIADEDGGASYKRFREGKFGPASTNKKHKALPMKKGRTPTIIGRVRKSIIAM